MEGSVGKTQKILPRSQSVSNNFCHLLKLLLSWVTNFFLILASLRVISPGHSGGEAGKEEGLATMSLEFELYL